MGGSSARTSTAIPYDNDFIFDVLPWNFEPSEMGAAFGLQQLDKLDRSTSCASGTSPSTPTSSRSPDAFVPPRQTDGLDTAWLCYPLLVRDGRRLSRSDLQEYLDSAGIDTRTVWTGNVTRQPMMKGVEYRQPPGGLPNSDRVMETGLVAVVQSRHDRRPSGTT